MSEFFEMGGYALYVWPSYGLFVAVLIYNIWVPLARRRTTLRKMKMLSLRSEAQRRRQ